MPYIWVFAFTGTRADLRHPHQVHPHLFCLPPAGFCQVAFKLYRISPICTNRIKYINDFIDANTYTLTYCTVDDAYTIINKLGQGALLSKIYLKNTFRLMPVGKKIETYRVYTGKASIIQIPAYHLDCVLHHFI